MTSRTIGKVKITTDADGKTKLVRVHKLAVGQRKAKHAKAARQEKAWKGTRECK